MHRWSLGHVRVPCFNGVATLPAASRSRPAAGGVVAARVPTGIRPVLPHGFSRNLGLRTEGGVNHQGCREMSPRSLEMRGTPDP